MYNHMLNTFIAVLPTVAASPKLLNACIFPPPLS